MEKANSRTEGKLENLAKANEEFEKAIELDKNLPEAYFNQALTIGIFKFTESGKRSVAKIFRPRFDLAVG